MSEETVVPVNLLEVKPRKQDALIALLKDNTETVIRTLPVWKKTRLIAARDGAGVVISSEWEDAAAVAAMRANPRVQACFPKIMELASVESIVGSTVISEACEGGPACQPTSHKRQRKTTMGRMVVIYPTPGNAKALNRHYFHVHVPLAKKIPGLRKYEVSDGRVAMLARTVNIHRIRTLYFDDLAVIEKAFASPARTGGTFRPPPFCTL